MMRLVFVLLIVVVEGADPQWGLFQLYRAGGLYENLTVKRGTSLFCDIPADPSPHNVTCLDGESVLWVLSDGHVALITRTPDATYYLEHGEDLPAQMISNGTFSSREEAISYLFPGNDAATSPPSDPPASSPFSARDCVIMCIFVPAAVILVIYVIPLIVYICWRRRGRQADTGGNAQEMDDLHPRGRQPEAAD